jgi:hypothetical protein
MKNTTSLIILFFFLQTISAQEPKVTVYDAFKVTDSINTNDGIKLDQNCIKWNLSLLGRGSFTLNYEHSINQHLTIEIDGGLTYRDFIYEGLSILSEEEDYGLYDQTMTPSISYMAGINLRFYPKDGDLEGLYFSPLVRYRNYKIDTKISFDNFSSTYPAGYKMTDLGFVFGYQFESWWFDAIYDNYFGISYSYIQSYTLSEVTDSQGDIISYSNNAVTKKTPMILIGTKIGFSF